MRSILQKVGAEKARSSKDISAKIQRKRSKDRTWSAPRDRTWAESWRQEGVKRAKLGPRWRQVGAKSGQRERRGGLRSDLEPKSWILKLVVFHWEYVYFLDIGSAKWRQVGDKI